VAAEAGAIVFNQPLGVKRNKVVLPPGYEVIGLSVPFLPRRGTRPTTAMVQTPDTIFYQLYFQEPGVAEAELERDVRTTIRRILYSGSGDRSGSSDGGRARASG